MPMSSQPVSEFRAGHVALIGRPNVGKSSLLNAFVGAHLVAVSAKPHTTRQAILGVRSFDEGQLAFVDTPGLVSRRQNALQRSMGQSLDQAVDQVDLLVQVIEAGRWTEADRAVLARAKATGKPIALLINKVDLQTDKAALLPFIEKLRHEHDFVAVLLTSVKRRSGIESAMHELIKLLPVQGALYGDDTLTDRSERFLAAELIREQLMRQSGQEVPYACAVEIENFVLDGALRRIAAVIWVERDGQKAIIIGEGGQRLKDIGRLSRIEMERLFDGKVFLELWVKVRADWTDDARMLKQLGY